MKKLFSLLLVLTLLTSVTALAAEKIVIGATPSPHEEILEYIKADFEALGYELEIITFTDIPAQSRLADGQLDANYFQHFPYLDSYNQTVTEDQLLAAIGVHYEPYGIYAGQAASIEAAGRRVIAVTNDPSSEPPLLLRDAG